MSIDLSSYDWLVTYPPGRDWSAERQRVLFLQTAIRLGFDWFDILKKTGPFFQQMLCQPPVPVVFPFPVGVFPLPMYDVAWHTPEDWAAIADYEWNRYRDETLEQIVKWRNEKIQQGKIVEFPRRRKATGINRPSKKADIAEEQEGFEWAAVYFFGPGDGAQRFADLARIFPDRKLGGDGRSTETKTRKRAGQIQKRVLTILSDLGLPARK